MDEFLQDFLHEGIRIKWNAPDEIEYIADMIDQVTGSHYDRQYMRGYSTSQYPYWGVTEYGDEHVYCLFGHGASRTYTSDEFISMLGIQDESVVDISALL